MVTREIDGVRCEPYELLTVEVELAHQGAVMEALGARRGDLLDMQPDATGNDSGRVRLDYRIPARGLIGFQSDFLTMTRGTGVTSHVFDEYGPMKPDIPERRNGVLVSAEDGVAVAYALWKLQERGRMFVRPGDPLYEGMVIGLHSRDNDLVVNPVRTKQLTNIRAAGKDEAILLTPPILHTLESAIEFIGPAPGEKLHEELVGDGETASPSPHPKIDLITRPPVDADWLEGELALLERLVSDGETLELVGELHRVVDDPKRARSGAPVP